MKNINLLIAGKNVFSENQIESFKSLGFSVYFHGFENEELLNPDAFDVVIGNNLFRSNDISKFTELKAVQLLSSGYDEAVKKYCDDNRISFFTAKGIYSIPIAETVIMQILGIYKNSALFFENQKNRIWEKNRNALELFGKKALIVGYGAIGFEIAKRLEAFGVMVFVANRTKKCENHIPLGDLKNEISGFDIVISSIASNDETRGIFDKNVLSNMKEGSVFVNVSRGDLVDEQALIEVLKSGKLLGAYLDVAKDEPLPKESELWGLEGVYITPHNAFISENNNQRIYDMVFSNLKGLGI